MFINGDGQCDLDPGQCAYDSFIKKKLNQGEPSIYFCTRELVLCCTTESISDDQV